MKYLCGLTFAPFARKGDFCTGETKESLRLMKERTGANFVIFVPSGLQETPQSETIDFNDGIQMGDDELEEMIDYAKELGLMVALKPTVNCKNGTWRAHISFFDEDVPCEPKWGNWFRAYTAFQLHYAAIAQKKGCEMFIAGCEMVMSEHRDAEWRKLIADIKEVYTGPVSYNTDKYQEHNVTWWDAVDVMSSSGYYPAGDWDNQLDRIEKVVQKFQKPFFFAETGCMSTAGSAAVPNDWRVKGEYAPEEQAEWFSEMLTKSGQRDWVKGFAIWSWAGKLTGDMLTEEHVKYGYDIYQKPAEKVLEQFYREHT